MEQKQQQHILGCRLELTCRACPEQYEVFRGHRQMGYLRLRHGWFYASYPDCSEDFVYQDYPNGEGDFCDYEREEYLTAAVTALLARDEQESSGPPL